MSNDRQADQGKQPDSPDYEEQLSDLVAKYVERLTTGARIEPEEILSEYPTLAPMILEELEAFVFLGTEAPLNTCLGTLGDYTLRRQIGRGGMGVVYDAWQGSMDRRVALKVLPGAVAADDKAFNRFMREARAAGKLNHPNVVAVHAMGQDESTPYYAMEYVEGETLAQVLAKIKDSEDETETPFGPKNRQDFFIRLGAAFADVADGLQHAHSRGVTHRDIKPSNLILDGEGRLRILDFGLARLEGQESLTLSGDFVGTPLYMSPEQARRRKIPVDHRTDVYSLGATMYEAVCGQPPFRGKDHQDTLSQIIDRDPVEPRRVNQRIPRELETIVLKCLRKDPGDRYGTAEALGQDLRRFVRGDPIEARPQPGLERFARRLWRNRGRLAALAAVLLLAVTGSLLLLVYYRENEEQRKQDYVDKVTEAVWELELGLFEGAGAHASGIHPRRAILTLVAPSASLGAEDSSLERAIESLESIAAEFPQKPDAHYHLARGLSLLGQTVDAEEALDAALRARSDFVPALLRKATLLAERGETEEARGWTEEAKRRSNRRWHTLWIKAYTAGREGSWQEAAKAYEELIRTLATDGEPYLGATVELWLGSSRACAEAGQLDRAVEGFAGARALWPEAMEPNLCLGHLYCLQEKDQEAERIFGQLFDRARSREAKDAAALAVMAVYWHQQDLERAVEWANRISGIVLRHRTKALMLSVRGKFSEGMAEVEKALAANSHDPLSLLLKGNFFANTCQPTTASKFGRQALDAGLGKATEHCVYPMALLLAGNLKKAEDAAQRILLKRPSDELVLFTLARVYANTGRLNSAVDTLQGLVELTPQFPPLEFCQVDLGGCLMRQQRFEEAEIQFRNFLRSAPSGPGPRSSLANALYNLGRQQEALEECHKARALEPQACWTRDQLGWVYTNLGKMADAEAEFAESIRIQEYWPHPYYHWSWLLAQQGRLEEAESKCRKGLAFPAQHGLRARQTLCELLARQGRLDESVSEYRKALEEFTGEADLWAGLAHVLTRLGRPLEAFSAYAQLAVLQPKDPWAFKQLAALFRREGRRQDFASEWDLLAEKLEEHDTTKQLVPHLRSALALGYLHGEQKRDWAQAMRESTVAVEESGRQEADLLATLAEVYWAEGQLAEATLMLEEALCLPEANPFLQVSLDACREELFPLLATFASADAALGQSAEAGDASSEMRRVLEQCLIAENTKDLLTYLEGRILQREEKYQKAIAKFRELISESEKRPEPYLRLSEALLSSGDPNTAEEVLRSALIGGIQSKRELWDLWLTLSLAELGRTPEAILIDFPAGTKTESGYGESRRQLLELLHAKQSVRIRFRDKGYWNPSESIWSPGLFLLHGKRSNSWPPGSGDDGLKGRFFLEPLEPPVYRIPLPPGEYAVTVEFLETFFTSEELDQRKYHLVVEGIPPPAPPQATVGVPIRTSLDIKLSDGLLDLEFPHNPPAPSTILVIEIRKLE